VRRMLLVVVALSVPFAAPRAAPSAPRAVPSAPRAVPSATPSPAASAAPSAVRDVGTWSADPGQAPAARDAAAWREKGDVVRRLFANAGVAFPPDRLLFRVFKQESLLEVWADGGHGAGAGRAARVATYEVCRMSGAAGPKRRAGDMQVPEGFYRVEVLNSASRFHLSMGIGYPNASDRVLSDRRAPGGAIMIHGACASIGCIAMGDDRIRELWVMASAMWRADRRTDVHVFPARDTAALAADASDPALRRFWGDLAEGLRRFETTGRIPRVTVGPDGRYGFR